ncbi:MAG: TIGR01841 family phasin [Rhodospirillaceae bacterium]
MSKPTAFPMLQYDISNMLADFKVPGVDFEPMIAAQRKNIEALTEANNLVVAGVQAVMKRQAEILQASMEQARTVASEIMVPGTSEAKLTKQAEVVQTAFQAALANMKELADIVTKSNAEAGNVISKRVTEGLDEIKAAVVKVAIK